VVFRRGTNDHNRFSLLELLAVQYGFLTTHPGGSGFPPRVRYEQLTSMMQNQFGERGPLPFPDLANIVIRRPKPDGRAREEIKVDAAAILAWGDCSRDVRLEWGDIVEIPELDHPVAEQWSGFTREQLATLKNCLTRTIHISVKGQTAHLPLGPDITIQEGKPVSCLSNRPFSLLPVLHESKLLRASSDLSRVRVRRHDRAADQVREFVFDCSKPDSAPDFWLRDGDQIEVREKEG
jgi:hypothetical protein